MISLTKSPSPKLRGRGGGGFPTGKKWAQVKAQKAEQKYVVCNGDEGDPGAFMDRSIMEGDPHRMLEGMMIAAVALRRTPKAISMSVPNTRLRSIRLQTAIEQAKEIGLLGKNILGSPALISISISTRAQAHSFAAKEPR